MKTLDDIESERIELPRLPVAKDTCEMLNIFESLLSRTRRPVVSLHIVPRSRL